MRTSQSNVHVAQAARTRAYVSGKPIELERRAIEEDCYIGQEFELELRKGETLVLEKLAATAPKLLACMHGAAFRGDGAASLRELARRLA